MREGKPDGDADHRVFDRVVGQYARTRPGYPDEALDWLADATGLAPGSEVLDLGAGTGKLTASLVARGYLVSAVEPLPGMRAQLADDLPGVAVHPGSAEQMPLADSSVDAVCVGQAFHWFEPGAALGEVARILRPGGWLALIWNLWDLDDPSQAAFDRIVSPLATGRIRPLTTGNHPYGGWSEALARDPRFEHAATARFAHTVELDAQAAGERVASISQVQSAPPAERDAAVARARALVAGLPGGRGSFRYQTEVEIRRRAPT